MLNEYGRLAAWYIVPVLLVVAFAAFGVLMVSSLGTSTDSSAEAERAEAVARKLPPYWTVREGESYSQIAEKTGLSVAQLEAFNPRTDPTTIVPGQRLKLRRHVARAAKPLGPRFWKVRAGQSFGSIAASTRLPIDRLLRLNPKLKPTALKVGDRVRLRR